MLLENSMPTACYFQRNSWKFEGSLIEVIFDLWPLIGGSKCLSSRKKVSVLHLSVCSFGDQSSQLILCLDRMYIFLNLDCPASVWLSSLGLRPRLDTYQTLAGQSRSRKMKILSRQRNFAIELCHLWAVLQMQHRTFILYYGWVSWAVLVIH